MAIQDLPENGIITENGKYDFDFPAKNTDLTVSGVWDGATVEVQRINKTLQAVNPLDPNVGVTHSGGTFTANFTDLVSGSLRGKGRLKVDGGGASLRLYVDTGG